MDALRRVGVVAALAAAALTPTATQAQIQGVEVRVVDFVGNETFPADSLRRAIATSETECSSWVFRFLIPVCPLFGWGERRSELRERDIPLDEQRLERWYQVRGFRGVDVSPTVEIGVDGLPAGQHVLRRWSTASRPPTRERVTVEPFEETEVASVRFAITEGQPILADSIAYEVPEGFEVGGLLDGLPISAGDRWSTLVLDATRDTLIRRLRNRSYPDADVLRQTVLPQDEPLHAHVTFEIEPGVSARYGAIRIAGLDRLDETTILRTLPFRTGDPYQVDQLLEGQTRLFGLEIIRNARVERDTEAVQAPDSVVPLFVQVTEGDPYRVRAGGGFNTAECFNTEARWTSRNFMGGGRVFQLRGRLANIVGGCTPESGEGDFAELTWLAAADFSQPWIFSTRNSFNASLFGERQSVPDIFIRRAVGLDLSLARAIGQRASLTLSYSPELSTLESAEVLLCTGFLVCRREDISVLTGAQRIAPMRLNLTRDLANSILNPTRGYRLTVDLEHAARWTGSEYRYNRAVTEGTWYSPLVGSAVLAGRARLGWVGWGEFTGGQDPIDIIHPQRRFYAGGASSVRGFGEGRLGPRVLAVDNPGALLEPVSNGGAGCLPDEIIMLTCDASALDDRFITSRPIGGTQVFEANLEIRVPLGRDFEVVGFGDVGQVWGAGQTIDPADLEFTPGAGVRYLSPIGPIRVDVGYTFRESERLSVVTQQIDACTPATSVCLVVDGSEIPYAPTGAIATLGNPVLFGEESDFLSRLQLHLSIGQAF